MGLDLFEAVGCLSRSSTAIIYKDNDQSVAIERACIQEIYFRVLRRYFLSRKEKKCSQCAQTLNSMFAEYVFVFVRLSTLSESMFGQPSHTP